jgi:hypothetical protein
VTTPPRELKDLVDTAQEDERPSITDVNGTVARFEMSYSPPAEGERVKFVAPLRNRIGSYAYLAIAIAVTVLVIVGYTSSPTSRLFVFFVEGDRGRMLSSQVLAGVLLVSGIATVIRATMRGVVVSSDWIEARYILPLGIPRARKWGWPQVHRIVYDGDGIAFELYEGSFEKLPDVADRKKLRELLRYYAAKRRIQVTELAAV